MVPASLLEFAAENYNFDVNTLNFITESSNHVYMFNKDGKGYIRLLRKLK